MILAKIAIVKNLDICLSNNFTPINVIDSKKCYGFQNLLHLVKLRAIILAYKKSVYFTILFSI